MTTIRVEEVAVVERLLDVLSCNTFAMLRTYALGNLQDMRLPAIRFMISG